MKTVFDNKMCAHVWAQQNQEHGRSNSMHFERDVIYSYQTPIARIVSTRAPRKSARFEGGYPSENVVLITSHTYSNTTSCKHMPAVHRAVTHLKSFIVPNLGVPEGRNGSDVYDETEMHERNYAHYVKLYAETMQKLSCARQGADYYVAELGRIRTTAEDYVDTFNLRGDKPMSLDDDMPPLSAEVLAGVKAKLAKAKAEKEAKEAAKQAELAIFLKQGLEAWRNGEYNFQTEEALRASSKIYMRVSEGEIITSRGARFPVDDAVKAFPIIAACAEHGYQWPAGDARRDRAVRKLCPDVIKEHPQLGSFRIDQIEGNGNVKAGCHYVEYSEIETLAKQLKLIA